MRIFRVSICLVLAVAWPGRLVAQDGWSDLMAPAAAFTLLKIAPANDRALAMVRAIRVLHSAPRADGDPPPEVVELERLLEDLDRLERELTRTGSHGISLAMAQSSERDALQDTLAALGLRLRERRDVYTVEAAGGGDGAALRTRLLAAGIDPAGILQRLNASATVAVAPAIVELPLPLPPEAWNAAVFERTLPARALFGAIIRDPRAAWLYHGLLGMTPATRAFLVANPGLVRHLYRDRAAVVADFGGVFEVGPDGRVVVPGGAAAVGLWEGLLGERVSAAERFARELFGRDAGRAAYFMEALARLDGPRRRFALGLGITDRGLRLDRFRELYRAFAAIDSAWKVDLLPFSRPPFDVAALVDVIAFDEQGVATAPMFERLWARGLDGIDIPSPDNRDMREVDPDATIDAAWLADRIAGLLPYERRAVIERVAFGQRVFRAAPRDGLQDVYVALRAYGRFPAAMLALERIGVRAPGVYARVARHAFAIERIDNRASAVPLLAQFQGALAILVRLARTGAVATTDLESLADALAAIPLTDQRYDGAVAAWVGTRLLPALPPVPEASSDARLLSALADRPSAAQATFEWEGSRVALDVTGTSRRGLAAIRGKQGGNPLDVVLTLAAHADALARDTLTLDQVRTVTAALKTGTAKLQPARPWPDTPEELPDTKKILDRVVRDLTRITKPQDTGRARQASERLHELADYLLGEILVAHAYASALGDPATLPGASTDPSHRHAFLVAGAGESEEDARRGAWAPSRSGVPAVPGSAASGSLIGLDLTLSKRLLRRLATDRVPEEPRINGNDASEFIATVALLNPRDLSDAGQAVIHEALGRGRARVAAANAPAALDAVAAAAGLSTARRYLLTWRARQEPERVQSLFTVSELFWAGAPDTPDTRTLAPWGLAQRAVSGCECLGLPPAGAWDRARGRRGTGYLGAAVSDLHLRVAEVMGELSVPAPLFAGVMTMATRDFLDDAPALYDDDWLAVAAFASALTRERIEDYLSALVASGPVRPVETGERR